MMNEKFNAMELNDNELEMVYGGQNSYPIGPWTRAKNMGEKLGEFFIELTRLFF